ncbi:hypothetical protein [Methanobrevibacter smithii]|uniref:hypothetical protein n=1 Tax=Methanobrevibacter smithii TaxID=2173 RepID=UPI00307ACA20
MKTKNFYLDEIKDFIKYDDSPTEFDFVKTMATINEFLETQKIKCVFKDINIYNKNIILDFKTYNQRKIIENILNEYGFVTKTEANGLYSKNTGFWIVGVKE